MSKGRPKVQGELSDFLLDFKTSIFKKGKMGKLRWKRTEAASGGRKERIRKRREYIIITAAVLGLIALSSVFASARTDEDIIRELVSLRTDTLSGFYAGEIEREDAIKIINSIEGDHLPKRRSSKYRSVFSN